MWELFDAPPDPIIPTSSSCIQCSANELHESDGSVVCVACGAVNYQIIDKNQDQAAALSDGSSINHHLPRSSLGTSISGSRWMKLKQVNDWWKWVYKEKSFYDDKKVLEDRCHKAHLSQAVIDNSVILYKKASESKHESGKYVIIRGINRKAIMAASVYYGARFQHQPCTPKEIADIFELDITQVTRGCKKFQTMVDLSSLIRCAEKNETYDHIKSFCFRKNFDNATRDQALEIVRNIEKMQIATHHQPPAVASAALLVTMMQVAGKRLPRTELAAFFKVSENTISKTFKEIYPFTRIIMSESLTNEYIKDMSDEHI